MRFFKRNKNKNLKIPERRTIFLLNDGSWKQPFRLEGQPKHTFNELIAFTQKTYKEEYVGAYHHYTFFLENDTILEIISKFSYEEVLGMWVSMGKPNPIWGQKISYDEEWNNLIIISAMLNKFGEDKTLGTGNVEMDNKLAHDLILISLARHGASPKKSKRLKLLKDIEQLIKRHSLPEKEVKSFNKIINSMKKA